MEAIPLEHSFTILDTRLLLSRPPSADLISPPDQNFARNLQSAIRTCQVNSNWRVQRYGDKAHESRPGFTPQDVRENYRATQDELHDLDALPTPNPLHHSDSRYTIRLTTEVQTPSHPSKQGDDLLSETPTDSNQFNSHYKPRKRRYSETCAKKHKNQVGKWKADRRSSESQRRRWSNGDLIPGEAGVSKIPDGNKQCQNHKTTSTALIRDSFSTLNTTTPTPYCKQPATTKDSTKKDTLHHPIRPQRIIKVRKKLHSLKPSRKAHQRIIPNRVIMTKKGRLSRRPERWVPDMW